MSETGKTPNRFRKLNSHAFQLSSVLQAEKSTENVSFLSQNYSLANQKWFERQSFLDSCVANETLKMEVRTTFCTQPAYALCFRFLGAAEAKYK